MIDREQNLRLGDARKLSQMMQGESVPSSGLSKQMAEELLHKHFTPYQPKAGEEYMSNKQLAHFRKILEAVKKELSEDIDRTVHTMQ